MIKMLMLIFSSLIFHLEICGCTSFQHKNINFEISRRFSSAEKPTSTQSTSLADEIMQSKLKDASNEKTVNNEDPSENSNKGPTKWQRIGYWAFAIIFGGALVVNGVLFCK